jgi:hypothetical protein
MKNLLFLLCCIISLNAWTQVYFEVQSPAPIQGYQPTSFNLAQVADGWTNVPDMTNPINSITNQLVVVSDGTSSDTLGCNPLTNGGNILGKIALVFRGTCDFSTKALNAQNEGAIGVVIVNNVPGQAPFNPGAGVSGSLITIPVVMISYETWQDLFPYLSSGVEVFIGALPIANNDLKFEYGFAANGSSASYIGPYYQTPLSQLQPWSFYGTVKNNGLLTQTGIQFNTTISQAGFSTLSNTLGSLASNVSIDLFGTNTFTPPAVTNSYQIEFSALGNQTDENILNNTKSATYHITDYIYALDSGHVNGGLFNSGQAYQLLNTFYIFNSVNLYSVDAVINSASVAGSQLRGVLYEDDGSGSLNYMDVTPFYTLTNSDITSQATITLSFSSAPYLNSGAYYYVGIETLGNNGLNNDVVIASSGKNNNYNSLFLDQTQTLYSALSTPMIRMNFNPCGVLPSISGTMSIQSGNLNTCNCQANANLSVVNNGMINIFNSIGQIIQSHNVSASNTFNIAGLCSGEYYVIGYDFCGVQNDSIGFLIGPSDFTVSVSDSTAILGASSCNSADGSVNVNIMCGSCAMSTHTYQVDWTGSYGSGTITQSGGNNFAGALTVTIPNLLPGTYDITITSITNSSCNPIMIQATVIAPSLQIQTSLNNATNCTSANGSIDFSWTASSGSYTLSWSGPNSGNTVLTSLNGNYSISNLLPGTYTLSSTDVINLQCEEVEFDVEILANQILQDLCVVSVDETTANHNLVFWEKPADMTAIDSFYVYREITLNNYQIIGSLGADELSLFEDFGANPNASAYKYKVAVLDSCGNIGDLSLYHNSIHLQYLGLGNFQWTPYQIENTTNQVASYNVYRDDIADGNWQILPNGVVPGSQQTYTDVNYASFPNALYRVDVNWLSSNECTATKANINTSRSNTKGVAAPVDGIQDALLGLITLVPNPTNGAIRITLPDVLLGQTMVLTNAVGQILQTTSITSTSVEYDLSNLADGIYFVQVQTHSGVITKKIVKN